jgi:hypothetical protein
VHFNRANAALDNAMAADPQLAALIEKISPGAADRVGLAGGRQTPVDMVWHHAAPETVNDAVGVMQLVTKTDHWGDFWAAMHPGNRGGFAIWGPKGSMWS